MINGRGRGSFGAIAKQFVSEINFKFHVFALAHTACIIIWALRNNNVYVCASECVLQVDNFHSIPRGLALQRQPRFCGEKCVFV